MFIFGGILFAGLFWFSGLETSWMFGVLLLGATLQSIPARYTVGAPLPHSSTPVRVETDWECQSRNSREACAACGCDEYQDASGNWRSVENDEFIR